MLVWSATLNPPLRIDEVMALNFARRHERVCYDRFDLEPLREHSVHERVAKRGPGSQDPRNKPTRKHPWVGGTPFGKIR